MLFYGSYSDLSDALPRKIAQGRPRDAINVADEVRVSDLRTLL